MDIRKTISEFICSELLDGDDPVESDENLLADGMIDSLGMLRLVAHVEESFGFKVPPDQFTIVNFRTIEAIDTYLSGAISGAGGDGS